MCNIASATHLCDVVLCQDLSVLLLVAPVLPQLSCRRVGSFAQQQLQRLWGVSCPFANGGQHLLLSLEVSLKDQASL